MCCFIFRSGKVSQSYFNYLFGILVFSFFIGSTFSEEACKFTYKGIPELLNGETLVLPEEVVAMSEYVYVGNPSDLFSFGNPASIFFIIDNSPSNYQPFSPGPTDINGTRFTVTQDLVDSLKRLTPFSEVGLAVFVGDNLFGLDDDGIFVQCPNYNNGYIPLLQLNKNYQSDAVGNTTGYDILQHYLDTTVRMDPLGGPHVDLRYTNNAGGGTNIDAGFDAAKHAMESSKFARTNRFIIFISDGVSNGGSSNYIQGEETPTTFTVFLLGPYNNDAPQQIYTMTKNIQENKYSSTNPKSNLWSIETDHETLKKLLMENVINEIITQINSFKPDTLAVNGKISGSIWDSTGFTFNNMFPLVGKVTDFQFKIDYTVTIDSILENGDTIQIDAKDTSHIIDFSVEIEDNAPLPDSVELTCWGRKLEFFHSNTKINSANETMDKLEIRFSEYEVDTLYHYENVKVEITHSKGKSLDLEKFEMKEKTDYWTYTFPRKVDSPDPGDKTLQHNDPDSIVAIFRNPDLPLDTLRLSIPYRLSTVVEISKGIYFDNNADGYIDSLYIGLVGISGKEINDNFDELMDNIILPAHRKLKINKEKPVSEGIALNVTEEASTIQTYVTDKDVLTAKDSVILPKGGLFLPCKANIIDSVAPIIMKASLIDSMKVTGRDELTVELSETIKPITEDMPFKYFRKDGAIIYDAQLKVIKQNGKNGVFEVKALQGVKSIVDGDSIRINWTLKKCVSDDKKNQQDNPENRRREISVTIIKDMLKVNKGVYFDNNADGFIDSMFISVLGDKEKLKKDIKGLMDVLEFPKHRKLEIKDYGYTLGGITVEVKEKTSKPMTNVIKEDVLVVEKETTLPNGALLDSTNVAIIDSMAPVILTARLEIFDNTKKKKDDLIYLGDNKLIIVFSEKVMKITKENPFTFYSISKKKKYTAAMNVRNQKNETGTFRITTLDGISHIESGDSIRINWEYEDNIYDSLKNNQDNPKNIRRELKVKAPFDLIFNATLFDPTKEIKITDEIANIPEIQSVLKNMKELKRNTYNGLMVLTLEPNPAENVSKDNSYTAEISIFDALGNEVLTREKMGYEKSKKRLIYLWPGENNNERQVGLGAYLAIISVERTFIDEKSNELIKRLLGVKD